MAYDPEMKAIMQRDLAQYVGMQIKLRRTELRLTIKQVSDMTGITPAIISMLERGETDVRLSTLALLRSALLLDISVGKITTQSGQSYNK